MKVLYSQLTELIPTLKATPNEVATALTVTGIMVDSITAVEWDGKPDFVLGLEVRQNRPDCLGVRGIAREVAAYFGKKLVERKVKIHSSAKKLTVTVRAKEDVRRVVAVKLEGLRNQPSPLWLTQYLEFNGINSINLIVDLSNWAMLYTGFPNHIFDADKVAGTLVWERSPKNQELTTLDGTVLNVQKDNHLVIADSIGPLVLASSVGGKRSAVSMDTKNVLIEVASYNPAKLLRDARSLNVSTEAGNRLQKELATEPVLEALNIVVQELIRHAGGVVASQVCDYYPKQPKVKPITFSSNVPGMYAGIEISEKKAVDILIRLGFAVKVSKGTIVARPPAHRTDIFDTADCIEEVVRMVGFQNIPIDIPPTLSPVANVTPKRIPLIADLKTILVSLGFDEVMTLPLTTRNLNALSNYHNWAEVTTQNSINEEFPVLRQSLASGLLEQEKTYLLKNVEYIRIFESGKVFGKVGKNYQEKEMFAALLQDSKKPLYTLKNALLAALLNAGAYDVAFIPQQESRPVLANPYANFSIHIAKVPVGVLFACRPQKLTGNSLVTNTAFFEIDVNVLSEVLQKNKRRAAVELTEKLVILDANIVATHGDDIPALLGTVRNKIGQKLWDLSVVDEYEKDGRIKLTVRVQYIGLSDAEAKRLHTKLFA